MGWGMTMALAALAGWRSSTKPHGCVVFFAPQGTATATVTAGQEPPV